MRQQIKDRGGWFKFLVSTCMVLIGVALITLLLLCVAAYLFGIYIPQAQAQAELEANKAKWLGTGALTYIITIEIGGGLSGEARNSAFVRNGVVVGKSEFKCVNYCIADSTAFTRMLTVESLFAEAAPCIGTLLSCTTQFDPKYGFPNHIQYPCIDCSTAYIRVIEFRLNPIVVEF